MDGSEIEIPPKAVSAQDQPHDFRVPGGIVTIHPTYRLETSDGRVHYFEWHKFCGPTFLRADGEPRVRFPGERNPLWASFNLWAKQGHMVDGEGKCIWKPECPEHAAAAA